VDSNPLQSPTALTVVGQPVHEDLDTAVADITQVRDAVFEVLAAEGLDFCVASTLRLVLDILQVLGRDGGDLVGRQTSRAIADY
jgi:hypothetical protein